jgi:KaiC/GvpD/RAD55 family RecA-like ATPase
VSRHAAHVYRDVGELADAVARFLAAGFEAGEPALVVATRDNLRSFVERLEELGWDTARIERQASLVVADAVSTLRSIVRNGRPSPVAFEAVVGTLLDELAAHFPGRTPRVFGEMVNVLCERGDAVSAIELEELWNHLARTRSFSLLCGYRAQLVDRKLFADVCRLHTHVDQTRSPVASTQR